MSKTPRICILLEVRKYVFERDRYQCKSCGKTDIETNLNIDHIIALSRGGKMTSAICKLYAALVTSRRNTILIPDLDDILINVMLPLALSTH